MKSEITLSNGCDAAAMLAAPIGPWAGPVARLIGGGGGAAVVVVVSAGSVSAGVAGGADVVTSCVVVGGGVVAGDVVVVVDVDEVVEVVEVVLDVVVLACVVTGGDVSRVGCVAALVLALQAAAMSPPARASSMALTRPDRHDETMRRGYRRRPRAGRSAEAVGAASDRGIRRPPEAALPRCVQKPPRPRLAPVLAARCPPPAGSSVAACDQKPPIR
jgi:hypothetical protein